MLTEVWQIERLRLSTKRPSHKGVAMSVTMTRGERGSSFSAGCTSGCSAWPRSTAAARWPSRSGTTISPAVRLNAITGGSTRKAAAIRAAGRFSLCAQDERPPYKYVTVEGPVTIREAATTSGWPWRAGIWARRRRRLRLGQPDRRPDRGQDDPRTLADRGLQQGLRLNPARRLPIVTECLRQAAFSIHIRIRVVSQVGTVDRIRPRCPAEPCAAGHHLLPGPLSQLGAVGHVEQYDAGHHQDGGRNAVR